MDRPITTRDAGSMASTDRTAAPTDPAHVRRTRRVIRKRSFAILSTTSDAGFAHAAGVQYATIDTTLYVNTLRSSRKARNIAVNDRVAVVIPVRQLPIGPPFVVQFQARASLLTAIHPEITKLLSEGELKAITAHGELDEPDGCFVRITPTRRIHTYGLGVSPIALARDPLHVGERSIELGRS